MRARPVEEPSELRTLIGLAWPVALGQLGLMTMGVVDLMVVGSLGEVPLAGIGLGNTWSTAGLVVGVGVSQGLDPFITKAYGAGRPAAAGRAFFHGLVLILLLSAVLAVQHALAGPVLRLLGQPDVAIPGAHTYNLILILGILPALGFGALRQLLQGGGSMRPAMWVIGFANVVNLLADALLVFGLGLGLSGAAWATVVVRWVMLAVLIRIGWPIVCEAWPEEGWSSALFRQVAGIALPSGLQVGFEVWAFNASTLLAGLLGTTVVAAHTAALSITALIFMLPLGTGAAASTRVGNLVGAERSWRRAGWTAIALGGGIMVVPALFFWNTPGLIARAYTADVEVVGMIVLALPVAAAFGIFDGMQAVAGGVLRGLGDTRGPALIALFAYWVVALPAAWMWMPVYGIQGIWMGLATGLGLASLLLCIRVWRHP